MLEDMPDRMPDRMPEDMSGRMPEDLPVTKRINVMVGMTRSKVIFFSLLKVWINTKAKARRATRRVAMPIVGRIPSTYNERMIRGTSWKPCKCHSLATQPATAVSYGSNATTDATKHLSAKYCAKCSKDFFRNQSIFYDFDQKNSTFLRSKSKKVKPLQARFGSFA